MLFIKQLGLGWVSAWLWLPLKSFIMWLQTNALASAVRFHWKLTVIVCRTFQQLLQDKRSFCERFINKPVQPVYIRCFWKSDSIIALCCSQAPPPSAASHTQTLWSSKHKHSCFSLSQPVITLQGVNKSEGRLTGSTRCILYSLPGVFTQDFKTRPYAFFPNYCMMCARPAPPTPTHSHSMFWFVVFLSAHLHEEPPNSVVSPHFALAKDFSGLLFLAAADSFPTSVFCCGEGNVGKMERVSVWVWVWAYVHLCVCVCVWEHT